MPTNGLSQAEFGDFQTPLEFAREVCGTIARTGFAPATVIEPTCGRGAFLQAALEVFPQAVHFVAADLNGEHVRTARRVASRVARKKQHLQIIQGDFFHTDWPTMAAGLPKPILILGNPPWVTNAALGALQSSNLPEKVNQDRFRGIEALTGKSNFDISEWMLRESLGWLVPGTLGMLAVLCKTAVARKVLAHAWSRDLPIESAEIRRINAERHFGASVDACLLIARLRPGGFCRECLDFAALDGMMPQAVFGLRDGDLVADVQRYERWRELKGPGPAAWRSGIKHDRSDVFELVRSGSGFTNGQGEVVDIEPRALYPLLKSSDLARNRAPRKWLVVPQKNMASSPEALRRSAPRAWRYLVANREKLAQRRSSIYRGRPPFSVFGVGDYTFARWKVAISGLYKKLAFVAVPPFRGKPVVFDDTCYFLPCRSEPECHALQALLQSEPSQEFLSALVFWDAKRPITAQILNRLNLAVLARTCDPVSNFTPHPSAELHVNRLGPASDSP